jgi:DNA-binding CsgD family transcriptional regulator
MRESNKYFNGQDFESIIVENSADGFITHKYIKDLSGIYLYCCPNQARAAGFDNNEDLVGLSDFDMWDAKESAKLKTNDQKVIFSKEPKVLVEQLTRHDGMKIIGSSFKSALFGKTKKIIGVIGLSIFRELERTETFNLSFREMDCLFWLVKGFSIKQISTQLHLSSRTIEHYLENIKLKLNCRVRSELIAKALHIPQIRERMIHLLAQ